MCSFSWSYGKMFYVYSNDTSDYSMLKKRKEELLLMENFKLHVQMLVLTGAMTFGDMIG
jgi:hypothetical protein